MNDSIRHLARRKTRIHSWVPPVLRNAFNRAIGASIVYRGPFSSWKEARASTSGYDEDAILGRIIEATQQVLRGQARYEQDGVAFHDDPPASHALSGLLLAVCRDGGRLSVLDFGGGLASHYLRWRPMLERITEVHWAIVEQAGFAEEGRKLFATNPSVSFHEDAAQVPSRPNAILASSVLQYLPDPYATLQQLIVFGAKVIILDRTPYGNEETALAQLVPTTLGKASYPLWVLSRTKVHALLSDDYELISEFDTLDHPIRARGIRGTYRGSIWLRRA